MSPPLSGPNLVSVPGMDPDLDLVPLILHRDAMILVLNKPCGLPVHRSTGPFTSLDTYFHQLQFGLPKLPALAHRLDRETSGCLVLGRHPEALRRLGLLFQGGKIGKTYWALVEGHLASSEGTINAPLMPESPLRHRWKMKTTTPDDPQGKKAVTHYKLIKEMESHSLIELIPETGRTHQLRVHCASIGHPILGDGMYGVRGDTFLCLHARSITLPLSSKKDALFIEAPLPPHMEALIYV